MTSDLKKNTTSRYIDHPKKVGTKILNPDYLAPKKAEYVDHPTKFGVKVRKESTQVEEGVNSSHVGKPVFFKAGTEQYGKLVKVQNGHAHISVYDSDTGERNIVMHPANRVDLDESVNLDEAAKEHHVIGINADIGELKHAGHSLSSFAAATSKLKGHLNTKTDNARTTVTSYHRISVPAGSSKEDVAKAAAKHVHAARTALGNYPHYLSHHNAHPNEIDEAVEIEEDLFDGVKADQKKKNPAGYKEPPADFLAPPKKAVKEDVVIEGHNVSIQYTDWMKLSPDAQASKHKMYPTLKIIGEPKQPAAKHKSVSGGTDGVRPQDIVLQYDYYKSFDGVPDIDSTDVIERIAKKRNCSFDVAKKALNFFAKREGHKDYDDAYEYAVGLATGSMNESLKTHDEPAGNAEAGHNRLLTKLVKSGYKFKGSADAVGHKITHLNSPQGENVKVHTQLVSNGVVRHTITTESVELKEDGAACTSTSSAPHMGVPGASGGKKPPKDKLARRKTQMESYKVGDRVTILTEGNRIGRIVGIVEEDGSYIVNPNSVLHRGVKLDNMNLGASEIEPFVDVKSILENLKSSLTMEAKGENPFAKKDDGDDEDDDSKKDDKKDDDKKCDKCDGKLDDDGECPKCDDEEDDDDKKVDEAFYSSAENMKASRSALRDAISGKKKKTTITKESVLVELDALETIDESAIKNVAVRLSMNSPLSMAESLEFVRDLASELALDEEVRFNTSSYYGSHGKEPRGTGNWMISAHRDLDFSKHKKDVDYIQHNGTLSSAKAVAAKHAKANGHTEMHVMP